MKNRILLFVSMVYASSSLAQSFSSRNIKSSPMMEKI